MYKDLDYIKQENGIYQLTYESVDYAVLEKMVRLDINVQLYVDITILAFLEQKKLLNKIEIIKRGSTNLIEINPKYIAQVDMQESPTFHTHRKVDACELVDNMPEGLDEEKWIDSVLEVTGEGINSNTFYKAYQQYCTKRVRVPSKVYFGISEGAVFIKNKLAKLEVGTQFKYSMEGIVTKLVESYGDGCVKVTAEKYKRPYKVNKGIGVEVFQKL